MKEQKKAIVIGSGIGGLASAIRLAKLNFDVTVFEKNNYPGGKNCQLIIGDYQFDAGPSLFTQPELIEDLFKLANEPIDEYFTYSKQSISCKYFYQDGVVINGLSNPIEFAEEIQKKTGEDANKVKAYLRQSEKTYNAIGTVFLNYSLHKMTTLFRASIFNAIKSVKMSFLTKTLNQVNESYFSKPHTIQLFNRYATFNGSNPYKAPGMLSLIPHLDNNIGTFYPKGGMISISNALYNLAIKKGVKFNFNSEVSSIVTEKDSTKGIIANNVYHTSDVVVSNMDVYFTYKKLLSDELSANKVLKQERSSSAFIFYWGIKRTFPELELHNIFFSKDYHAEFESLFTSKELYEDPTIYINITAKCEPELHAPAGKENWFVMVNAPANSGQDWQDYYQRYKKIIINKLSDKLKIDIEPLIEVEEVLTPISIESRTSSYLGSLYGTSSNGKMSAFLRHPNFSKKTKGLYLVGGSVHPGGGIPLCFQSAKIMSEMVQEDFK